MRARTYFTILEQRFMRRGRNEDEMAKPPLHEFSAIVEAIYDCALDPEKWRGVLPKIANLLESEGSTFAVYDIARNERYRYFDHGIPEAAVKSYFETYAPLNPVMPAVPMMPIGAPWTLRTLVPEQEYFESRFYKEWSKPNAHGDLMGMLALRAGSRIATHAINRLDSQPLYSAEELALYTLIAPHICRSLTISDALDLKTVTSQALEATLSSLTSGVYLVARDRRVVFMNKAAEQQIAKGTSLTIVDQRLMPTDAAAAGQLNKALNDAVHNESAQPAGGHAIALPATPCNGLIATVLPLERGGRHSMCEPFAAAAAVFVQDPRVVAPLPGEAFATLYHLTASELRIVLAMAPGLQLQEIADMFGISLATVKSHLARIFDKTGTSRQADLMALIARISPAVSIEV